MTKAKTLLQELSGISGKTNRGSLLNLTTRFIDAQTGDHSKTLRMLLRVPEDKEQSLIEFRDKIEKIREKLQTLLGLLYSEEPTDAITDRFAQISSDHAPIEEELLETDPKPAHEEIIKEISGIYLRCVTYAQELQAQLATSLNEKAKQRNSSEPEPSESSTSLPKPDDSSTAAGDGLVALTNQEAREQHAHKKSTDALKKRIEANKKTDSEIPKPHQTQEYEIVIPDASDMKPGETSIQATSSPIGKSGTEKKLHPLNLIGRYRRLRKKS